MDRGLVALHNLETLPILGAPDTDLAVVRSREHMGFGMEGQCGDGALVLEERTEFLASLQVVELDLLVRASRGQEMAADR